MSIVNKVPLPLDLKSGNLVYEGHFTSCAIHNAVLCISTLKAVHMSYALVRLLIDFKMESLHVVILTDLWLSLLGTSTYWTTELFHREREELFPFNSFEFWSAHELTYNEIET